MDFKKIVSIQFFMVIVKQDVEVVKEWFFCEVRFDRYVDKFELNGFIILELCCIFNENVFDKMEIVLLYYWK